MKIRWSTSSKEKKNSIFNALQPLRIFKIYNYNYNKKNDKSSSTLQTLSKSPFGAPRGGSLGFGGSPAPLPFGLPGVELAICTLWLLPNLRSAGPAGRTFYVAKRISPKKKPEISEILPESRFRRLRMMWFRWGFVGGLPKLQVKDTKFFHNRNNSYGRPPTNPHGLLWNTTAPSWNNG